MKLTCKICGFEYEHEKAAYCIRGFINHLRTAHHLTKEEYIIQYERNGIRPTCACGCGNYVEITKGWNTFKKYYKDSHVVMTDAMRKKISKTSNENFKKYLTSNEIKNIAISAATKLKSHNYTLGEVASFFDLDKRTLKRYLLENNVLTVDDIKYISNESRSLTNTKRHRNKYSDEMLEKFYNILKNFSTPISIYKAMKEYLYNNDDAVINYRCRYKLIEKLIEKYGEDEIKKYLTCGYHSNEEDRLYIIFTHFFGKSAVKYGVKIGDKKFIYDFLLFDNLIIEYDGTGYYHQNDVIQHDNEKELWARENGYNFLRLTYKETTNINILNEIIKYKNY